MHRGWLEDFIHAMSFTRVSILFFAKLAGGPANKPSTKPDTAHFHVPPHPMQHPPSPTIAWFSLYFIETKLTEQAATVVQGKSQKTQDLQMSNGGLFHAVLPVLPFGHASWRKPYS